MSCYADWIVGSSMISMTNTWHDHGASMTNYCRIYSYGCCHVSRSEVGVLNHHVDLDCRSIKREGLLPSLIFLHSFFRVRPAAWTRSGRQPSNGPSTGLWAADPRHDVARRLFDIYSTDWTDNRTWGQKVRPSGEDGSAGIHARSRDGPFAPHGRRTLRYLS